MDNRGPLLHPGTGPTAAEFRAVLTRESVRQIRILQIALTAAPIVFFGGAVALSFLQTAARPLDPDMLPTLSLVNGGLALLSYAGAFLFSSLHFSPARVRSFIFSADAGSRAGRCLILIRNAVILRLAMLEGAAFFGVAVCLIAVTSGNTAGTPEYWLNAAPVLILLLTSAATFPTEERLVGVFEQWIQSVPAT